MIDLFIWLSALINGISLTKLDPVNSENYSGVYEVTLIRADGWKILLYWNNTQKV